MAEINGLACESSPKKQAQMNELAPDAWAQLQEQTSASVILDVRTAEEFESGYIKGALNLDISCQTYTCLDKALGPEMKSCLQLLKMNVRLLLIKFLLSYFPRKL